LQIDASGNVNIDSNTLYVDATNNRVGLGDSAPANKLQVLEALAAIPSLGSGGHAVAVAGSTNYGLALGGLTTGEGYLQAGRWSGAATAYNLLLQPNGGSVGIGTAVVNSLFEVRGTTDGQNVLHISNNAGSSDGGVTNVIRITCNGNTNWANARYDAYAHSWNVNSSEAMRIDGSKRLLVGTSAAPTVNQGQYQVSVEGTSVYSSGISLCANSTGDSTAPMLAFARTRGTTAGSNTVVQSGDALGYLRFLGGDGTSKNSIAAQVLCEVDGTPGTGDMPGRLVFSTTADGASSPTERLRLTAAGLFQSMPIYNTTGGDAANVVVNSNGTVYRSTSSAKYKTDIETLQDEFADAVLGLRPVWYRSTCAIDNPTWSYWGFIAEEVAEIDPRLVSWKTTEITYDEKGSAIEAPCAPEPEGVQYDRFVPHLLNLIKRQKEQIETMEARLSALEAS
jgi:hypothetical protein